MNQDPILLQHTQGAVAFLTLNRPQQRNALSMELMGALLDGLREMADRREIKVIIIRGNGPGFCAGHDLKEMRADTREHAYQNLFKRCAELMLCLIGQPQPVIAQVHGIATAAGCQLVATCDLAVAADTARFATPGVNIGLFCSTPMVALSRNVHPKHAMEMLLTGEMIDAKKAARLGLINRAVAETDLESETLGLARQIAERSPVAVRMGKRAFYEQLEMGRESAYEYTGAVMVRNMLEDDAAEGIDAFIEKRRPSWSES